MEKNARVTASFEEIRGWLTIKMAGELRISPEEIDPSLPFGTYGVDSLRVFSIIGALEESLNVEIPEEALYLCNNIDALSNYLSENKHLNTIL